MGRTIVTASDPGTHCFAKLKAVGVLNEKGRILLSQEYTGRVEAKPDWPLTGCGLELIERLSDVLGWSSDEAKLRDLRTFREHVTDWLDKEITDTESPSPSPTEKE